MKDLVNILKENNQDYEWYPTTNEMIDHNFIFDELYKEDKNDKRETVVDE